MNTQMQKLLTHWDNDRPSKGTIFDYSLFRQNPNNPLACMCAQGQVLAIMGGYLPKDLIGLDEMYCDPRVAKLLNISLSHAVLLREANDKLDKSPSFVLRDPEYILGEQWSKILDFWWMVDQYGPEDWEKAVLPWIDTYNEPPEFPNLTPLRAAHAAAEKAVGNVFYKICANASEGAGWFASWKANNSRLNKPDFWNIAWMPVTVAVLEIQGFDNEEDFFALPLFGIKALADIPPRPSDYALNTILKGEDNEI